MTDITFRPIDQWPGDLRRDHERTGSPFRANYDDTLRLLERELRHLDAKHIVIQLALREGDFRLDGLPRSDAKAPEHPGVIVAFDSRHGPLKYATDAYASGWRDNGSGWKANLRAIALGLEALRTVDRYGITKRGEQYTGWKAIGAGIAMGAALTLEEAERILIDEGEWGGERAEPGSLIDGDAETLRAYYREAVKKNHPDVGGDPERFARVKDAYDLLLTRTR